MVLAFRFGPRVLTFSLFPHYAARALIVSWRSSGIFVYGYRGGGGLCVIIHSVVRDCCVLGDVWPK